MTSLHDFTATTITGDENSLADYEGKVVLVVNTASECGLTPQYEGLEKLWQEHQDAGLVVLGFPCHQFGEQEPGTEAQIAEFTREKFGVTFPMFAKVDVNGENAHPVWKWLKQTQNGRFGEDIGWNFTKFLVGRDGQVLQRFGPQQTPAEIADEVTEALG